MKQTHSYIRKSAMIVLAVFFIACTILTVSLTRNSASRTAAESASVKSVKPAILTGVSRSGSSVTPVADTDKSQAVKPSDPAPVVVDLAPVPLNGTVAVLESKGSQTKLTGSDGLFDRVMVKANEPVALKLILPNLLQGKEIIVTAPNGGKISRADGGALRFKADADSQNLDLIFQPGISLGAYSVIVMHQGVSQTFDFWVGPQHPLGQPGPTYSFNANNR